MNKLKSVCVFCGSRHGIDPQYTKAAEVLGQQIARKNLTLVYGGGSVGLMGELANSVLQEEGRVIGVIPEMLASKELLHPDVKDMRLVKDMHTRKALMSQLSDAFIALPGGFGTLEEILEVITWAQLGFHRKPIGILNVNSYYDPLNQLIDRAIEEDFIDSEYRHLVLVEEKVDKILDRLIHHQFPIVTNGLKSAAIETSSAKNENLSRSKRGK